MPQPYFNRFEYIRWDEEEIVSTLTRECHWETARDTQSTWKFSHGTAAFYNLLYYIMAGLTENDTFRTGQIRKGFLSGDGPPPFRKRQ